VGKNKKDAQSGQAMIEYILLLSIVIGILVALLPNMGKGFDAVTLLIGGKMEAQLRTGASASVWQK
jgi:hypothetical protein